VITFVGFKLLKGINSVKIGLYGTDLSKICQATVGLIIQTMLSNIIEKTKETQ
jgi:uncharacterized membrane protein